MQIPDLINAIFQCSGTFFVILNIMKISKDKKVKGISWLSASFFTFWGIWNLYYFPLLNQTFSGFASLGMAISNMIYTIQLIYYSKIQEKK